MSRKDYIKLAMAINELQPDAPLAAKAFAKKLVEILKADNPKFDPDRFLAACGMGV